jgi:hypothetical protein
MVRPQLAREERGAVLVSGLFTSAFLVGLAHVVVGVAVSLHHRNVFQDAADAGAHGMAVMSARAMNLIALMNLLKAALAAVMVPLLASITAAQIMLAKAAAKLSHHTVAALLVILALAQALYKGIERPAEVILDAAQDAQDYLRDELPFVAEAKATALAAVSLGEGAPSGDSFAWPLRSLPTEGQPPASVCKRLILSSAFGYIKMVSLGVPHHDRDFFERLADGFAKLDCLKLTRQQQLLREDAEQGDEPFQQRFFNALPPLPGWTDRGARTATWLEDEDGGRVRRLRDVMSRMMFAESESYFAGPGVTSGEMMWLMKWQPRLRRFRFPSGELGSFAAQCARTSAAPVCAELARLYGSLGGAVVH